MPVGIIKGSYKYATENIYFFLFIFFLMLVLAVSLNFEDSYGIWEVIVTVFIMGYGLQVTKDVIDGGSELPKINLKKIILLGVKGIVVFLFYISIQGLILYRIASYLNFPEFELEDALVHLQETLDFIFKNDPLSCIIFYISGFIVAYALAFFMELALARLADGGDLKNAFNFPRIKRAIDIIGWRVYTKEYSKIVLSIVIITVFDQAVDANWIVENILDIICYLWMFIIHFRGMGVIYKMYTDKKVESTSN